MNIEAEEMLPNLPDEVEAAIKSPKKGIAAGIDNIHAELLQTGGEVMIDSLTTIGNKIWKNGES
jgi:hypothetical protein